VKVLDDYLDRGINILSEIFVHSTFPEDEFEKEKKIIKRRSRWSRTLLMITSTIFLMRLYGA